MASKAEVARVRQALAGLSESARQSFLQVWASLDLNDWAEIRRVLEEFWPELIGHFGEMAAVLASDQFLIEAAELGISGDPRMVRGVDPDRANARMRWALGTPSLLGSLLTLLDELVKQPYRSTLQGSAARAGVAWARVPSGSEPCAFCLMLASRGAVYESRSSAQFTTSGRKYHGDCYCVPILTRGDGDLPYDAGLLSTLYERARNAAGSGSTKDILAELRAQQGIH